jgi:hypothetical protein
LRHAESVDQLEQLVEGGRVWRTVPPGPRRDAQLLDGRERLVTLEPLDDPPERAGKPPNIVVEWEVFFSGRSRRGHGVNDTP